MLYYYLDGLDKKGPYNLDELKSRNITLDTLVFNDGMANWKSIKEIPELYSLLFDLPVETQTEHLRTLTEQNFKTTSEIPHNTTPIATKAEVKMIRIPSAILLAIGIAISVGLSYIIVQGQRTTEKKDLDKIIDALFQSKDEICDFKKNGVQGKLQNVVTGPIFKGLGTDNNSVQAGNQILAVKPETPSESDGGEENIWYQDDLKKWNLYKDLVDYYECTNGGFTVLTLSKKNNGFDLIESYSKNMGFKIATSRYISGVDYGYGISTQGYSIPTDRGTVQEAYDGAMEYLSKEKENKSYIAGIYDKIKTFDEINTDFFYIDNVEPSKHSSTSVNAKSWKSSGDPYIYNSNWIVWYAYDGKHYEILEDKKIFNKRWAIYSGIGTLLAIVIYISIRYRRTIALKVS